MSSFYKDFRVLRASVEKGVGKLTSFIRACVLGGMWDNLLLFGGKYEDCSTLDDFSEMKLPLFNLAVAALGSDSFSPTFPHCGPWTSAALFPCICQFGQETHLPGLSPLSDSDFDGIRDFVWHPFDLLKKRDREMKGTCLPPSPNS